MRWRTSLSRTCRARKANPKMAQLTAKQQLQDGRGSPSRRLGWRVMMPGFPSLWTRAGWPQLGVEICMEPPTRREVPSLLRLRASCFESVVKLATQLQLEGGVTVTSKSCMLCVPRVSRQAEVRLVVRLLMGTMGKNNMMHGTM